MLPVFLPVLHDVTSCAAACRACVCVCCCVAWAYGCGPWWDPAATGLPVVCSTQTGGVKLRAGDKNLDVFLKADEFSGLAESQFIRSRWGRGCN